jgi:hypothetical protein
MQALCLAVLSDQGKTKPARIAGRGDRYGLSVEPYFAAAASDLDPKIVSRISVRPEPSRPAMPRISPWCTSKLTPWSTVCQPLRVDTSKDRSRTERMTRPHHGAIPAPHRAVPADHRGDDPFLRERGYGLCQDMTPVAQNSHAIGEEHDFLDPVEM